MLKFLVVKCSASLKGATEHITAARQMEILLRHYLIAFLYLARQLRDKTSLHVLSLLQGILLSGHVAKYPPKEASRYPTQMPEPPLLAPLNVEEQRLYSESP